jgi:hypothetical protein
MNPIANYELGQTRHRELEAKYSSHWPEQYSQVSPTGDTP